MGLLNDVKAASDKASSLLSSSCPKEVPLTPVARLDAVLNRFHAMSLVVQMMRGPLTTFYNSLDDGQKTKFAALGEKRHGRRPQEQPSAANLEAICKQQSENFTLMPVQRIEDTVKPDDQQKSAFEALKSASSKAASELTSSCPTTLPTDLNTRLDAIDKRLGALTQAANEIKPALTDFYKSLSDDQKARFNVMGGPPPQRQNGKTNG